MEENKNIDIRTQSSDLNSIEKGGEVKPYNPVEKEQNPLQTPQAQSENSQINLESLGGGTNYSSPQSLNQTSSSPNPPQKKNSFLLPILVFVVIIGLGLLGYFVVYPLLMKNGETENQKQVEAPLPQENQLPQGENFENKEENPIAIPETTTPSTLPNETTSPSTSTTTSTTPGENELSSLLKEVNYTVTSSAIITGKKLNSLKLPTTTGPALIEVVFTEKSVTFSKILNEFLEINTTESGIAQNLEEKEFSEFIYLDKNGKRWLGLIGKIKENSQLGNLIDVKFSISQIIESNPNLKNFFSVDPGTQGAWKNGSLLNNHKFTTFSKQGFSIDYGWKNNIFIISSSFEGLKEVLNKIKE